MRFTFLALLVLAAMMVSLAKAEDPPKRAAELQVLDHFVGTWDIEVTIKQPGQREITNKGVETRKWSHGGKFVVFENGSLESEENSEFHMLVTYDPATKTYPGVMMFGPGRSIVTGTWDAATSTMTFNGKSPEDGGTFVFKNRFPDKDHSESSGILKNGKGEVFMEQTQKQTRRKK